MKLGIENIKFEAHRYGGKSLEPLTDDKIKEYWQKWNKPNELNSLISNISGVSTFEDYLIGLGYSQTDAKNAIVFLESLNTSD